MPEQVATRWSETPTPETARAAELLRLSEPPPVPSEAAFARIEARLRERSAPARRWRRWVATAVATGATAQLALALARRFEAPSMVERPVPSPAVPARPAPVPEVPTLRGDAVERVQASAPSAPLRPPRSIEPNRGLRVDRFNAERAEIPQSARKLGPPSKALRGGELAQPSADPVPWPRPERPAPVPTAAPPVEATAQPEDPLELESRSLGVALSRLGRDGDAAGALRALADYRARYPDGALRGEADAAEIEADLRLGRDAAALQRLDGLATRGLDDLPRAAELRVLRAELLARAGRGGEALSAFEALAAATLPSQLRERVLRGRAALLVRSGSPARNEALRQYLAEYPAGPFAAEARRALDGL
ncbi:MAG: tetratricopeptide repeat protein [Myxococcales bacterium]